MVSSSHPSSLHPQKLLYNNSRQLGLLPLLRLIRLGLLNLLQNRLLQTLRLGRARPAPDNLALRGDQELLKVPLDPLQAHDARHLVLHPLPHGLRLVAVDLGLAQHRERHAVVDLAEGLDLVVGARVLAAELVAGEAEDGEGVRVLGLNGLVEGFEALELRGEAAFGGSVDGEDDFASEGGEGEGVALLWKGQSA